MGLKWTYREGIFGKIKRYIFYFPSVKYGLAGGLFERGDIDAALLECVQAISYGYGSEFQRLMQIEFFDLGVECCKTLESEMLLKELVRCAKVCGMSIEDSKFSAEIRF